MLARGGLPLSACSNALLQVLRPVLDSGVVAEEKSGGGRRLVARDAVALRAFFAGRYPDAQAFSGAPNRIVSVGSFRDSKTLTNNAAEIVCVRAWSEGALLRDGLPVDVVSATREHGVFAFSLEVASPYSVRGVCALVENPVVFALVERLTLTVDLALYGRGRISNRLLDWLVQTNAPNCKLIHLPDYDPVGLNEFARIRARLGDRVELHLPVNLPAHFARFAKRSLLEAANNQVLLRNLRRTTDPEIRSVIELIEHHNGGLEQEALLLDADERTSFSK